MSIDDLMNGDKRLSHDDIIGMYETESNVEPAETELQVDEPVNESSDELLEDSNEEQSLDETQDVEENDISSKETVHKYKADGEEFEVDFSSEEGRKEALKALSLAKGARKAFSDRAKLARKIKQMKYSQEENQKKIEGYDNLNALYKEGDIDGLFKAVTGDSLEDIIQKRVERAMLRDKYGNNEEMLKMMDREDEIAKIKKEVSHYKTLEEKRTKEEEQRQVDNHFNTLRSLIIPELRKYNDSFEGQSEVAKTKLRKMLLHSTIQDLTDKLADGYDITNPKLVGKMIDRNAKALQLLKINGKKEEVKKAISNKKKQAKENAQAASTQNYVKKKPDLSGMGALDIFNEFAKG